MITSRSNPLVKQIIALRQRKTRSETGLFLVEGIHHIGEADESGWDIDSIVYAPDKLASDFAHSLISRVSTNLQTVSPDIMEYLSEKDNPQGILAVVRQRKMQLKDIAGIRFGAAIIAPQDPGNVGTILRTLDAVKADALFLLDGGVDPYHPTSVRASMGTMFWIPIIQTSFVEFIDWQTESRIRLIGTSAHAETFNGKLIPEYPWILLLGSEQKGLLPEHLNACEKIFSLPMRGRASSLNLSIAAGIFLYLLTENQINNS